MTPDGVALDGAALDGGERFGVDFAVRVICLWLRRCDVFGLK